MIAIAGRLNRRKGGWWLGERSVGQGARGRRLMMELDGGVSLEW
jgi:hypothetical protein